MKKLFYVLVSVLFSFTMYGQAANVRLITKDMSFELRGDTLFSTTGLKLFVGQTVIAGTGAAGDGYYRFVTSSKAAIKPSIWGQDRRYEYAIENHISPEKSRAEVRQFFLPGDSLSIARIVWWKNSKPNFYLVWLTDGDKKFACDIKAALCFGELLLKP